MKLTKNDSLGMSADKKKKYITYTWVSPKINYKNAIEDLDFDELVIIIPSYVKFPPSFENLITSDSRIRIYESAHMGMEVVLSKRAKTFIENNPEYELKLHLFPRDK